MLEASILASGLWLELTCHSQWNGGGVKMRAHVAMMPAIAMALLMLGKAAKEADKAPVDGGCDGTCGNRCGGGNSVCTRRKQSFHWYWYCACAQLLAPLVQRTATAHVAREPRDDTVALRGSDERSLDGPKITPHTLVRTIAVTVGR